MKKICLPILLAASIGAAHAADAPAEAGVSAVEALGRLNGQALACSETAISAQAKQLMLKYAPRTSRYGTTFEQATQLGFADQVKSRVCPAAAALSARLDAVAEELGRKLPAVQ